MKVKKIKIFHIYANDINLGDFASAQGIKTCLKNEFDGNIIFYDKFATTDLLESDIDFINKNIDGVIIGGGGLLRGDKKNKKNHILGISINKIRLINKPIFTYAIGINYEKIFSSDIYNAAQFLEEKSKMNSVRDKLSRDIINNSELVLCPSMLIENHDKISLSHKKMKIGIVPVPLSRVNDANVYIKKTIEIINNIKKLGFDVELITHSKFPEDIHYEINKRVKINLLLPSNPSIAMHFYREFDIIIGTRGHSLIFAAGQLVPFINLSYNIKCDEFCKIIEYPPNLSFNLSNYNWDDLAKAINYIINNSKMIQSILLKAKKVATEQNSNYSNKIIKYLEKKHDK